MRSILKTENCKIKKKGERERERKAFGNLGIIFAILAIGLLGFVV